MTRGQIAQLQELSKCYMPYRTWQGVVGVLTYCKDEPMSKEEKAYLRRLAHQYRNQIAAMKKNRKA